MLYTQSHSALLIRLNMKIREYKPEDKEQVVELWKSIFTASAPHHNPELSIERKLEFDNKLFFVAVNSHKIIGTVMGGYDGHRGWLYSLAVHREYRRKGVGKALVHHVENELKKLNCLKINLQVLISNREVIDFYKKIGYNVEERISMGKKIY